VAFFECRKVFCDRHMAPGGRSLAFGGRASTFDARTSVFDGLRVALDDGLVAFDDRELAPAAARNGAISERETLFSSRTLLSLGRA
jgi:hypothetical protein